MFQQQTISRRHFLRIAGAGASTLALAACVAPGAPNAAPAAGSAPSAEAVILRVQNNPDVVGAIAERFHEHNANIEIEFISVTGIDHEEVASKILSMVAAGQAFDLGNAATEATQLYAGQGLAVPIDDWVLRDEADLAEYFADVHPALIEAMFYEGHLYQICERWNAANMFYNTALFAEAGYDHPAADWTMENFYEIAKAITKKNAGGETDVFGYAWTNRLWGSWTPWIFVNGSNLLTEERAPGGEWFWSKFYADDPAAEGRGGGWRWLAPKANDPANVEALSFMVEMTKEGVAPAIELGGGATLQGFFTAGKLGMTPAGAFWAGGLFNAGMAPDTFDVQLFPRWQSQRHQFGSGGYFIFKDSKFKEEGWAFQKFSVSLEALALDKRMIENTTTPPRRSVMTAEKYAGTGPKHWEVFYNTLDEHPDTAPIPAPPVSNPMTTLYTAYTGRAMNFEMTPQEALDGLQKELEDLYARTPNMYPG
ncbi:MAG: extracellular solute-binding protein [Caldilinea sp. CFX5]|nr:extracellular solute-binding protein [Caldilinea sp. CFX5]